jgi:hypothetical protein
MTNNHLEILFIALLLFLVYLILMAITIKSKSNSFNYKKQGALFTKAEINFLRSLEKYIVNTNVAIFGKVRIADIITPKGVANNSKRWWQLFVKISSKHVDYVLCDKSDYSVICVIELNDRSHNTAKAKLRDDFVRKAYRSADIKLIEITASRRYDFNKVIGQFPKEIRASLFFYTVF